MLSDSILIVFISVFTALLAEGKSILFTDFRLYFEG